MATVRKFVDVLTEAEVLKLHEESLTVLETVGMSVPHPKVLAALEKIGCVVEHAAQRVKVPRALAQELLTTFKPNDPVPDEVAVIKGSPNLDAAKKYVDWALTAEAQEIPPTVQSYQLPTNPDATVSEKSVKLSEVKLVNYDFVKSAAQKAEITERFDADIVPAPKE